MNTKIKIHSLEPAIKILQEKRNPLLGEIQTAFEKPSLTIQDKYLIDQKLIRTKTITGIIEKLNSISLKPNKTISPSNIGEIYHALVHEVQMHEREAVQILKSFFVSQNNGTHYTEIFDLYKVLQQALPELDDYVISELLPSKTPQNQTQEVENKIADYVQTVNFKSPLHFLEKSLKPLFELLEHYGLRIFISGVGNRELVRNVITGDAVVHRKGFSVIDPRLEADFAPGNIRVATDRTMTFVAVDENKKVTPAGSLEEHLLDFKKDYYKYSFRNNLHRLKAVEGNHLVSEIHNPLGANSTPMSSPRRVSSTAKYAPLNLAYSLAEIIKAFAKPSYLPSVTGLGITSDTNISPEDLNEPLITIAFFDEAESAKRGYDFFGESIELAPRNNPFFKEQDDSKLPVSLIMRRLYEGCNMLLPVYFR